MIAPLQEHLKCQKLEKQRFLENLDIKGIHLYLPQYCERNSCHNVKIFLLSSGFSGRDCDSHLEGKSKNLEYVRV